VGSAIDGLIYDSIQIGAQPIGVDSGSAARSVGDDRPRYEPARWKGPEFCNRYSVATDDEDLPGLYIPKNGTGVVAQLALGDDSRHT
jgi:hypothetical protein